MFVREGLVWHLHLDGEVIRTTAEHPFFTNDRGWVGANELKVGDWLLTEGGRWRAVEEILDTGCWEIVYNVRIADHHTYFVGDSDDGSAVWAHNADYVQFIKGVTSGPSGVASSLKYLLARWDKGTFARTIDSIKYHTRRHGNGLSAIEYTKLAMAALDHPQAVIQKVAGRIGSTHKYILKIKSPLGNGSFTINGGILTFSPKFN